MKQFLKDAYWPLTILVESLVFLVFGFLCPMFEFVFFPLSYGWVWLGILFIVVSDKKKVEPKKTKGES